MNITFRWLMVAAIVFQLLASPVYGASKAIITRNQLKAIEYITQLKAGADPNSLTRPQLRRHNKWKVKQSRREINKAMDEAEALARAGKHHLIQKPEFVYKGLSE